MKLNKNSNQIKSTTFQNLNQNPKLRGIIIILIILIIVNFFVIILGHITNKIQEIKTAIQLIQFSLENLVISISRGNRHTAMESNPAASPVVVSNTPSIPPEKRNRSIFDVPADFFDSCKLLRSPHSYTSSTSGSNRDSSSAENTVDSEQNYRDLKESPVAHRWTCNTCKAEFESLLDQRSHFKSDLHRFNVTFLLILLPAI